jgi:N-acylneuraminate cytidylyltransferase
VRILALVPARGGSKRIPGKNIRLLGGKPLVAWTIDVAKDIPDICDILVSTDDPAIAQVCLELGALVPWLRPAELATDAAGSVNVALHALDWYEVERGPVDGLLLLQPTSPFRTGETLRKGIEYFKQNFQLPVLGVSPAGAHPLWALKSDGDRLIPYFADHGFGKRSQDLPAAFAANGSFYLISPKVLRENLSFLGEAVQPLLIDSQREAVDIDTEQDWALAERLVTATCGGNLPDPRELPDNRRLCTVTEAYLSENTAAFSLNRRTLMHEGRPKEIELATLGAVVKRKAHNGILGTARYLKEAILGWTEIRKLSSIKDSRRGQRAIVIGNGPSQGLISAGVLKEFSEAGNDIFAVNFWHQNAALSCVPPKYLLVSDPSTLAERNTNDQQSGALKEANELLWNYVLEHESIILVTPVGRTKYFKEVLGGHRVLGFVDSEMRWLTANIDPRLPRGYLSMTLFKALALAIHMGYEQIYLVGMDNTYPRDIFCDEKNRIFNYERHAGAANYLIDVTSQIPSMDVWAQDIFQIFHDLRRCFSGTNVLNLDCYSLTDVFPKISDYEQIETVLANGKTA